MNTIRLAIVTAAALALAAGVSAQQGGGGRGQNGGGQRSGLNRPGVSRPIPPRPAPQPQPIYRFPSTIQGVPAQIPGSFNGTLMLDRVNPNSKFPTPPQTGRPGRPGGWPGGGGGGAGGGWGGGGGGGGGGVDRPDRPWRGVSGGGGAGAGSGGASGGFVGAGTGRGGNGLDRGGTAAGIGTDGAFFRGRFDSGNSSVDVNVGSSLEARRRWVKDNRWNGCWSNGWCSLPYRGNLWCGWGSGWGWGGWGWGWNDPFALIYGNYSSYDPFVTNGVQPAPSPQQPAQPERELTPLEKADWTLQFGKPADAVDLYRAYLLKYPSDAPAMRSLSLALLDDRRVEQSIAMLMMAYQHRPQLASAPIEPDYLSGNDTTHRTRFTVVMNYANRTRTASAFFAAAVLAQSEGRDSVAQRLLDRATAAGLDKTVAEEMKLALAP